MQLMIDVNALPKIASGRVLVTFKAEDASETEDYGTIHIIDQDAYDAWMAENVEPGSFGIPFGSRPDGEYEVGPTDTPDFANIDTTWWPASLAQHIAEHYGVDVKWG